MVQFFSFRPTHPPLLLLFSCIRASLFATTQHRQRGENQPQLNHWHGLTWLDSRSPVVAHRMYISFLFETWRCWMQKECQLIFFGFCFLLRKWFTVSLLLTPPRTDASCVSFFFLFSLHSSSCGCFSDFDRICSCHVEGWILGVAIVVLISDVHSIRKPDDVSVYHSFRTDPQIILFLPSFGFAIICPQTLSLLDLLSPAGGKVVQEILLLVSWLCVQQWSRKTEEERSL